MGIVASTPSPTEGVSVEFDVHTRIPVEGVIALAEKAGQAIMRIYESEDFGTRLKSDDSPLTQADTDANAVICRGLGELAPHVPIISEENKLLPHSIREGYQYCWMVDPLDGTKEFVKRNGQFTVNIALIQGNEPVMGVLHVPVGGDTYFAVKGRGAFVRRKGVTTPISAAEFNPTDSGVVMVGSASHMSDATKEFVGLFKEPEFKQLGSSLKLMLVAEGTAHVYPRLAPTMEWDTAAADIIVREAGGVVLHAGRCSGRGELLEDWKDAILKEQPLRYNKEDLLNPCFVVFGKRRGA
ncbi:3 (2),5 -bisphosphate nucleotidase [Raphidocelis subcapitata]|uniref:3'(2'),5'-bisphosphate nucleotidase 1 n=1 Tax=Raphidocelis subcapitata TaxID=307507 RepID=A0A2V0NRB2_9CHLO|nr:3 (2),5 -bisphosphate nucleotidase [Raphidocelis subcapitata]|eukprot:GBF90208.1 3 (2),5 -bisphosphate nucleotidase [Raphidocelis subcapitata]